MSGTAKEKTAAPSEGQRSEKIRVSVKSVTMSKKFTVRGGCTVRQLKLGLSERLQVPAEIMVLTHSGRILRDPEILIHLKAADGAVRLCMSQRPPQPLPADLISEPPSLDADPDKLSVSPSSPLCLVEGLEGLSLTNRSHLTRRLLQDANQELGDKLQNTDVITQVQEHLRNPGTIMDVMHNEDKDLNNAPPESITGVSESIHMLETSRLTSKIGASEMGTQSSGNKQSTDIESDETANLSFYSTDPLQYLSNPSRADANSPISVTQGLQSLLEEITACPALVESLLSGPHVSSVLGCLTQNPDLAEQMLLSHPLFSGNPLLQQHIRQQIPLFLQQMQSPDLLSAMLNPRAMEALLQIQQALQTLAAEAPALIPTPGLGNISARVDADPEPDFVLNDQSGNGPGVATVTEQQKQFVQQMLQTLANTNRVQEEQFQEELQQLSSIGFTDREKNLQALISTGGDLSRVIHLLSR